MNAEPGPSIAFGGMGRAVFYAEHGAPVPRRALILRAGRLIALNITQAELYLGSPSGYPAVSPALIGRVGELHMAAGAAVHDLIGFKTLLVENVLSCRLFTADYPLLLEHMRREA